MSRDGILYEISEERRAQFAKHGDQAHLPGGAGGHTTPVAEIVRGPGNAVTNRHYAEGLANQARSATNAHAAADTVTFADILLEEVFEALAESEGPRLRAELLQVAAVAVQWVEAIDRAAGERMCAVCGCTDADGCWPPCSWAGEALCTSCVTLARPAVEP